jgi:predicted HNH restriction endonuclease
MIPQGLTKKHFLQAAAEIDRVGVDANRNSVYYDLILNDKPYPPKYVISLAAKYATGREFSSSGFNAVEAKNYFLCRGYTVIDRRDNAKKIIIVDEDDESKFPEGRERYRQHRSLERDGTITRRAKAKRLDEKGKLECEVCSFDFTQKYGELGEGFIEAHHKKPVSTLQGKETTKIADLALVCSNCHRMLHRGKKLFSIPELKRIYLKMDNQFFSEEIEHMQ